MLVREGATHAPFLAGGVAGLEGRRGLAGVLRRLCAFFILNLARKAGLRETEARDVVQQTYLGVAKKIKNFQYDPARGSFRGWLAQLTRWEITHQLAKREPGAVLAAKSEEDGGSAIEQVPDLAAQQARERRWDEEWKQHLGSLALERVRRQANPKHYQIFDLFVLKQNSAQDVCRWFNVSTEEVYQVSHRLKGLLREEASVLREKEL